MKNKRFFLFLATGGIAATLNYLSRFLFSQYFSFAISVIISFIIGLISGFFLMRAFVFQSNIKPLQTQAIRYLLVNMIALMQTLIISIFFAEYFLPSIGVINQAHALGHLAGVLVPIFTSYLGHKYWSFS